jgi:hypothetical protein
MPATPIERRPVPQNLGPDDDAATIEVERADPSEILPFLPVQSLGDLIGPLDERQQDRTGAEASPPTVPLRRRALPERLKIGPLEPTVPVMKTGLFSGSARWLVPLGLCTVVTLVLAAWALWGR